MTTQALKSTVSEASEDYLNSKCFGVKWFIVDIVLFVSCCLALM